MRQCRPTRTGTNRPAFASIGFGSGRFPSKKCSMWRTGMTTKRGLYLSAAAMALALALGTAPTSGRAPQSAPAVSIGATDIGGVVRGPNGPEAGVWVIAETTDLPTRFTRSVVTDDQGRYVVPDLPKAKYTLWVRGYGLVDSPKVNSEPGKHLDL